MMIEKNTTREEDYRDYEDRDIDKGWPYGDEVPGSETKIGNGSYGEGEESFEEAGNPGFQPTDESAQAATNGIDVLGDDTHSDTDDDAIEEAMVMALEDGDVDMSGVEIKVTRGVAFLEGEVETRQDRRRIELVAYQTPGIVEVRNGLTTLAVDDTIDDDV